MLVLAYTNEKPVGFGLGYRFVAQNRYNDLEQCTSKAR